MNSDDIMQEIRESQEDLRAARQAKAALEARLEVVNEEELTLVAKLGQLSDALQEAIASENLHAAVGGGDQQKP